MKVFREYWPLWLLAIVLVLVVIGFERIAAEFKAVCDEAGGTTVFDGRQYQCIKRVP